MTDIIYNYTEKVGNIQKYKTMELYYIGNLIMIIFCQKTSNI